MTARAKKIWVRFLILAALVGCGPRNHTIPDDLVGVWKTSDPKYTDRFLELTKYEIIFGTGDGYADINSVVKVHKLQKGRTTQYTISYVSRDGLRYRVSLFYDPVSGDLRLQNQTRISWTKQR